MAFRIIYGNQTVTVEDGKPRELSCHELMEKGLLDCQDFGAKPSLIEPFMARRAFSGDYEHMRRRQKWRG